MDKPIKSTRKLAIDDLYRIGTPDAAVKLVPFLWDEDEDFAIYVAWHLGVLLKNPEVEEKLSQYLLKNEQTPVNELTYIWRPFENNSDSALFIITSRLAYLIKVSSIKNAPSGFFKPVDPRIIIPIAAIETLEQGKLPKKVDIERDYDGLFIDELLVKPRGFPHLQALFRRRIKTLLGDPEGLNTWQFKIFSLNKRLQLNLLNRLINYRTPTRRDWIKLYAKDINYNFQKSWHYYIVLVISFVISLISLAELFVIMFRDPMNIINLIVTPSLSLLIWYFWVILLQGFTEILDPEFLITFSLLGIITFLEELRSLLIYDSSDININNLYNVAVEGSDSLRLLYVNFLSIIIILMLTGTILKIRILELLILGVTVLVIAGVIATIVSSGAKSTEKTEKPQDIVIRELAVIIIFGGIIGGIVGTILSFFIQRVLNLPADIVLIKTVLGTWIAIAIGGIVGVGLGAWYRAKDKIDKSRYLAILAFPFFCTFPIVLGYSSYAFYDWFGLNWQQITIIWIGILGVCTVLWQWGQKLDYEARNPFKGILDSVKDDGDAFN